MMRALIKILAVMMLLFLAIPPLQAGDPPPGYNGHLEEHDALDDDPWGESNGSGDTNPIVINNTDNVTSLTGMVSSQTSVQDPNTMSTMKKIEVIFITEILPHLIIK